MLPDQFWDEIRDYLANHDVKKRKVGPISGQVGHCKRMKKNRLVREEAGVPAQPVIAPPPVAVDNKIEEKIPVMRKKFSELSSRRQNKIKKSMVDVVRQRWSLIAPHHPEELRNCIGDFASAVEYSNVSLIKSISAAYKLADERKNEDRKTELLSIFVTAENVSREALSKIVGCNISARKFTQARHHGVHHGPGQPVNNTVHPRGNEVKRVIIEKFVKYLMERGVQTANGRTVSIPGKEGISLPNIKRLEGMQPLIKAFEEQGRRSRVLADRCEWISLRRQSMEEVIRVVCPQKHISMAALDVVGQQHGVLNFRVLKKKILELSVLFQDMREKSMTVLREIEDVEEGLSSRSKFRSEEHFCGVTNNCGPASHCHYYAFGKVDPVEALPESTASIKFPCGHYHRGVCAMCQQLHSFGGLLDDVSVGASENVLEKIKEMNLKYHNERYIHYKGHQARLAHESMAANKIKEKLKIRQRCP
jgi:hypothetical protein